MGGATRRYAVNSPMVTASEAIRIIVVAEIRAKCGGAGGVPESKFVWIGNVKNEPICYVVLTKEAVNDG